MQPRSSLQQQGVGPDSETLSIGRVGIALAAYRPDPGFFARQLDSIVQQEFKDWVCVITLDSPLEEVREELALRPFFDDPRFLWHWNEVRLGHKKNFERAIQLLLEHRIDAIATADQDDVWYPGKLTVLVEHLKRAGRLSLVHSDMDRLDADELLGARVWKSAKRGVANGRPRHLAVRNIVTGCSMLFDAELARRYPRIPEEFKFHDHWYAFAAASHGVVLPVNQSLLAYRQHGGNVVGAEQFDWEIALPARNEIGNELRACRIRWSQLKGRIQAAQREGVPVARSLEISFLNSFDLGLVFYLGGIAHMLSDPPLSRYCIRIGIGKTVETFARIAELFGRPQHESRVA